MKRIFAIVMLCCFSCKHDAQQQSEIADERAPIQWATYESQGAIKNRQIVLVSGDEEYRSEEVLPQLAKILSNRHGFDCTVLFAQDSLKPGIINPNYRYNIPGLHLLDSADLVVWFTRFRELPVNQMQYLDNYLKKGKPILAIRTATHAFNFVDPDHPFAHYSWNYQGQIADWHLGFGKKILGETWYTHHGDHKNQSTRGLFPQVAKKHKVLTGIKNGSVWGPTDVYGVRTPLPEDVEVILLGETIDRAAEFDSNDPMYGMKESDTTIATVRSLGDGTSYNPNEAMPPLVWSKSYQVEYGRRGKAITSTIGSSTDFLDEEVRRLLVNASYYLLGQPVPKNANVDLLGEFSPSAYQFHDDAYWVQKNLKIVELLEGITD